MGAAVFDLFKKGMQDRKASCFFPTFPLCKASKEAGGVVCMAGRAIGNDLHDEGIRIAVHEDLFYMLEVGGFFSFVPELLTASGEKPGLSCLDGFLQGFLIHISHHEDLAASGVLHNGRHKAFFIERNVFYVYCFHNVAFRIFVALGWKIGCRVVEQLHQNFIWRRSCSSPLSLEPFILLFLLRSVRGSV